MNRFSGYWWSPDAKSIAYTESDTSGVEKLTIVDVMHPEQGGTTFPYPRPGKANAMVRLGVTPVTGGKTVWVRLGRQDVSVPGHGHVAEGRAADGAGAEPHPDGGAAARGGPATGKTRVLLTEKDDAWLNLDQDFPQWLEDGSGFLWYTERNGGPEVELRAPTGELEGSW